MLQITCWMCIFTINVTEAPNYNHSLIKKLYFMKLIDFSVNMYTVIKKDKQLQY